MTKLIAAFVVLVISSVATSTLLAQDSNSGLNAFKTGYQAYSSGDYATARKMWAPLAKQGNPHAQRMLGLIYKRGHGVPQDYLEAVKWFRKAAQQGEPLAQSLLGWVYEKGTGASQDKMAAHMWFNIAAANGHPRAGMYRADVAQSLSPSQIIEAQQNAKRCMASGYQDCD
jgi:TPR repeat protein